MPGFERRIFQRLASKESGLTSSVTIGFSELLSFLGVSRFLKHIGELQPRSSLGVFILPRQNNGLSSILLCEFKLPFFEIAVAESYPEIGVPG